MLIFNCKKEGYILINYVCDGNIDCPNDKSDESDCNWKDQENLIQNKYFKNYIPNRQYRKCPPLYQTSKDKYCRQFNIHSQHSDTHKKQKIRRVYTIKPNFKCNDGYVINHFLVNDLNS